MKKFNNKGIRAVSFVAIMVAITVLAGAFVTPFGKEWGLYDNLDGFYIQPKNSIDALFLGTSMAVTAFNPMEMYRDYGISTYTLGTGKQSIKTSYYWLKEVWKYNKNSLKTVVLEVSGLKTNLSGWLYRKSLDEMRFGLNKIEAANYIAKDKADFLSYIFPVFNYHDRWESVDETDFSKFNKEPLIFKRGYHYLTDKGLNKYEKESLEPIDTYISEDGYSKDIFEESELEGLFNIVKFCRDKNIDIITLKVPQYNWLEEDHKYMVDIARENELLFIDMKYGDIMNPTEDMDRALHFSDRYHFNIEGSKVVSKAVGSYLLDNNYVKSVKDDPAYGFLDTFLEEYDRLVMNEKLDKIVSFSDYLKEMLPGHVLLISVKENASTRFSEEDRELCERYGLRQLSLIDTQDSYVGIISDDGVILERRALGLTPSEEEDEEDDPPDEYEEEEARNEYENWDDEYLISTFDNEVVPILRVGRLPDGTQYRIESAGKDAGNFSSICVNGFEESPNKKGINVVAYDPAIKEVVDCSSFDTTATTQRYMNDLKAGMEDELSKGTDPSKLPGPYKKYYDFLEYSRLIKKNYAFKSYDNDSSLIPFLRTYQGDEDISIILSVKGDAASKLSDEARRILRDEFDLPYLADIGPEDSYIGVLKGGKREHEDHNKDGAMVEYKGSGYTVSSQNDKKARSTITIGSSNASKNKAGINAVIYSNRLNQKINSVVFPTGEVEQVW